MNRIDKLFREKQENILSIYFTAGYPAIDDTRRIMDAIASSGGDIIEIGIPFSDPIADGPTIQESNKIALENGMTLRHLFSQLQGMRDEVSVPVILMGYLNPIIQYGMEEFCKKCQEVGVDGLILPDLPMQQYLDEFKEVFERYGLKNTFLISPQTSTARIREIDMNSDGFIYMVSSHSITGGKSGISDEQISYFQKVKNLKLTNPRLIGFGISDRESFQKVSAYAHGAIIGSAFIRVLQEAKDLEKEIKTYIQEVKKDYKYDHSN